MLCTSVGERSAVCGSTGTPRGPIRRHQIRLRPFWSWCRRWRGPEKKLRPPAGLQLFTAGTKALFVMFAVKVWVFFSSSNPRVSEVPTEDFTLTKLTNQYTNPSISSSSVPPPILPSFFSAVLELVGPAASSPPPSCASSWGLKVWLTSWEPPASSVWTGEVFLEYIRAHLYL